MQIATTPTSTDALLERKEILEGNKALIRARDVLQQEVDRLQPVLFAIKEEIKATRAVPDITRLQDIALAGELGPKRKEAQTALDAIEARRMVIEPLVDEQEVKIIRNKGAIAKQEETIKILNDDREKAEKATAVARETHATTMEGLTAQRTEAEGHVATAKKSLEATQTEEDELKKTRASEDIRLSNKGRDLAIYEVRIRKQAAAAGIELPETI